MPCMKGPKVPPPSSGKRAGAPATSKVGDRLRKDAALRKQLVAARRRRLEAIVAGSSPEDAPIDPSSIGFPRRSAEASATALPEDGEGGAMDAAQSEVARGLASGLGEAQAAILIAQRFLGSSLGGHFADAARGESAPQPFLVHEGTKPTPAASLRVTAAAAGAAAALIDEHGGGEAGGGAADVDALPTEAEEPAAPPFDVSDVGHRAATDAIEAAVARFGLREIADEHDRIEAARVATTLLPALDGDDQAAALWYRSAEEAAQEAAKEEAILEAARRAIGPGIAMTESAPPPRPSKPSTTDALSGEPRKPTAWEVDVDVLRKPPPRAPASTTDEKPPPRAPPPRPKGRRSHADWTFEVLGP